MSQPRQITLHPGIAFKVMFPKIGYHRVPPACAMRLGPYSIKYEMRRIAIPEIIVAEVKLGEAVIRLSSMAYGATVARLTNDEL
ncbi:MAG: hypothetical protein O7C75_14975 [Verrucomicrobia bacterium]|nr:hypothetical protein [Verrucomicrobiota bacterium]